MGINVGPVTKENVSSPKRTTLSDDPEAQSTSKEKEQWRLTSSMDTVKSLKLTNITVNPLANVDNSKTFSTPQTVLGTISEKLRMLCKYE